MGLSCGSVLSHSELSKMVIGFELGAPGQDWGEAGTTQGFRVTLPNMADGC